MVQLVQFKKKTYGYDMLTTFLKYLNMTDKIKLLLLWLIVEASSLWHYMFRSVVRT